MFCFRDLVQSKMLRFLAVVRTKLCLCSRDDQDGMLWPFGQSQYSYPHPDDIPCCNH